jgi:hypothetical protein
MDTALDPRAALIGRLARPGLDDGKSVRIAANRFAFSDGTIATHDGYSP